MPFAIIHATDDEYILGCGYLGGYLLSSSVFFYMHTALVSEMHTIVKQ